MNNKKSVDICYLCDKRLGDKSTMDHIIPDSMFESGDPNRPQLPVHTECNNKKSKDDKWFANQIYMAAATNPVAERKIVNTLEKAKAEVKDAYIIGKKPHDLIFALGILEDLKWGLEIPQKGQDLIQMKLGDRTNERIKKYLKTLCKGLFIYNMPNARPNSPTIWVEQYETARLYNRKDKFLETADNIWNLTKNGAFGEHWRGRILYFGNRTIESPNTGVIVLEFYVQIGIIAFFRN